MASRHTIAEHLSLRLHGAELAVDAALCEVARLADMLPRARIEAGLSAVAGQPAFDGTAAALTALTRARAELVRTHARLAALARRLGLDGFALGPLDKPDDRPPIGGNLETAPLREIGPDVNKILPNATKAC